MRWGLKLIFCLTAIVLMLAILFGIGRLTLNVLRADRQTTGVHDPMFAEEPETTPSAPTVSNDGTTYQDNSANWDVSVQTPVDQTADELGDEARSKEASSSD